MFINGLQTINKLDGTPYQRDADPAHPDPEKMLDITLGWVIVEAVLATEQGKTLSSAEQLDRYLLAQKFHGASLPVEVSHADAEAIKKQIALRFGHAIQISGQAIDLITKSPNGKDDKDDKKKLKAV